MKHCDHKNNRRDSYQWVVVANAIFKPSGGWKQGLSKIGFNCDLLMGRFVDRALAIDKAVDNFGVYLGRAIDSNRTTFGPHLAKPAQLKASKV